MMLDAMRRLLVLNGLRGMPPQVRIDDLRIYPVKSCGGISLLWSRLSATGLEFDRMFAVVNQDGVVQTQRQERVLATVRPAIDVDADTLTLTAGHDPLIVPLRGREGSEKAVVSTRSGIPMNVDRFPGSRPWLTRLLRGAPGVSLRGAELRGGAGFYELVRFDGTSQRKVADFIGGDHALEDDVVAFPDLFPLLITSVESLRDLNGRLDNDVSMDRFRPNIVVAGAQAFDEDRWAVVRAGDAVLRCLENDPRCQVPSIDQTTGQRDPNFEPTTTLRAYRRLPNAFGQHGDLADAGPMFGIYAAHGSQQQGRRLAVGDALTVLERSNAGSLHEYWSRLVK